MPTTAQKINPNLIKNGQAVAIDSIQNSQNSKVANPLKPAIEIDSTEMSEKVTASNAVGLLQNFCVKNKVNLPDYFDVSNSCVKIKTMPTYTIICNLISRKLGLELIIRSDLS